MGCKEVGVKVEGFVRDKDCPQRGDAPVLMLVTMVGGGRRCTCEKKITFGV